jgi:hypothetical protein
MNTTSEEEAMCTPAEPAVRQLDRRNNDGIDVRLLWNPQTNRVSVAVEDGRAGESFELEVDAADALAAFRHPLRLRPPRPQRPRARRTSPTAREKMISYITREPGSRRRSATAGPSGSAPRRRTSGRTAALGHAAAEAQAASLASRAPPTQGASSATRINNVDNETAISTHSIQ